MSGRVKVKVGQSCRILCDPMDYSMEFSRSSSRLMIDVKVVIYLVKIVLMDNSI